MTPAITLSQALADPALFGRTFAAPSFWTWRVVAKLIDGVPLRELREIDLAEQCSGRTRLPDKPVRRLILLAGRRAGKDRFLSAAAIWRAALCCDWRKHVSTGEQAVVILLGADKKQAVILRKYAEGLLQAPLLAREVVRSTAGLIEFRNGASLEIATNDARLVRGRSAIAVLGSECCHWRTDEYAASSDEEVVGAAEPSMAMCPDGGLLLLGSSVHYPSRLRSSRSASTTPSIAAATTAIASEIEVRITTESRNTYRKVAMTVPPIRSQPLPRPTVCHQLPRRHRDRPSCVPCHFATNICFLSRGFIGQWSDKKRSASASFWPSALSY
jgi:hypothetical protein